MFTYTVKARQTLLDAAIQATGTLEAVFMIAEANGLAVSDDVTTGQVLVIPETVPTNKTIAQYLAANRLTVGTRGDAIEEGTVLVTEDGFVIVTEDGNTITN